MSEENGEETKDPLTDEFDFYFSFTKPLVLDLPSSEDRAIAAAWVQKVEAEPETEEEKQLRLNYLKLLLFVLQRGRLSGIFKKQPPSGPLQPFPQGFSIMDMGNWMLEQDDGQSFGGGDARSVPYNIDMSNDLREFVATQEIPNFGIQMYYAWSSEDPIHKWIAFDEEKFPQFILDKIKQLKEIKSEEKNAITKNGSMKKKKIYDLNLSDKASKKRVKSPQEIERSQGRSFHTYMGLVGRMGNFNDKCDEDPEKFQRPEQRRPKCKNRSPQKKCPKNGGGAEDMAPDEDYDNLVNCMGGMNGQNRMSYLPPQNCPAPQNCPPPQNCPRQEYNDQAKGGSPAKECPQSPARKGFTIRADVEINQGCGSAAKTACPKRRMDDQCPEMDMTPQRTSPRSRTTSPNRVGLECPPPEGKSRGHPKRTGVCICSSPPCICPCSPGSPKKATSNANSATAGGRPSPDPCRNMNKSPRQDVCPPDSFGGGTTFSSFKTPDLSVGSSRFGNNSSNRTTSPPGRNGGPLEVVHCYDTRNVDPALLERIDQQYMDVECERGNKRLNEDYQNMMAREQQIAAKERQAQVPGSPRRGVFKPLAHSTPIMPNLPTDVSRNPAGYCPPAARSPPMEMYTSLDYPCIEESPKTYSAGLNQQVNMSSQQQQFQQQNYGECETEAPSRMRSPEAYAKPPCKKSPSQAANTSKSCSNPCAPGGNDSGRMANMVSMLEGMKLRTEAHREKCEPASRRSPGVDAACYPGNGQPSAQPKARSPVAFDNGQMFATCNTQARNMRSPQMFYSPQAKPTQQFSPVQDRGYGSLPGTMQNKPCPNISQLRQPMRTVCPPAPNPECYSNRQPAFDENDNTIDEILNIDSSESLDFCASEPAPPPAPPPSPMKSMPRSVPQNCIPQNTPQNCMPQNIPQNCMPKNLALNCIPQNAPQNQTPTNMPSNCMPQNIQQEVSQNCISQNVLQNCMPQNMLQNRMQESMQQNCMPQNMSQNCVPQNMSQNCVPQNMSQNCTPENMSQNCMPQNMSQNCMPQNMQQEEPQNCTSPNALRNCMPQNMQQEIPLNCISQNVLQNCMSQNIPQNCMSQNIPQNCMSQNIPQNCMSQNVPQNRISQNMQQEVPQNCMSQNMSQNIMPQNVPQNCMPQDMLQNCMSENMPQNCMPQNMQQEVSQNCMPQDMLQNCMPENMPQNYMPQNVPQNCMPQDMLQNCMPENMPQNYMPQNVPQNCMPQDMLQNCIPENMPQNCITQNLQQEVTQNGQQNIPQNCMSQNVPPNYNPQNGQQNISQNCMAQNMPPNYNPQNGQQNLLQDCMSQNAPRNQQSGQNCVAQNFPQNTQQNFMPQNPPIALQLQVYLPEAMPGVKITAQEYSRSMPMMDFGCNMDPPKASSPQWAPMNSGELNRTSPARDCQSNMLEVDARVSRPQRRSPQGSCPPQRTSPQRTSPQRAVPQRTSPGRNNQQECMPEFVPPTSESGSKRLWASAATMGSRAPDMTNTTWMSQQCTSPERMKGPTSPATPEMRSPDMSSVKWVSPTIAKPWPMPSDPRSKEMQSVPPSNMSCPPQNVPQMQGSPRPPPNGSCPPPNGSCPPPNGSCPPPSGPCPPSNGSCPPQQRSPVNYGAQPLNAEYQDDLCPEDMAQDNMCMNDEEYDQQFVYAPQGECENDMQEGAFIMFEDDFNQNCEQQNMPMSSNLEGAEECYDEYQELEEENCEPLPAPPQNCPVNRSMGGSRIKSPNQNQRVCNPSPSNRNQTLMEQFCGGMTNNRRH